MGTSSWLYLWELYDDWWWELANDWWWELANDWWWELYNIWWWELANGCTCGKVMTLHIRLPVKAVPSIEPLCWLVFCAIS